jgi:hypothetical protein
VYSGCKWTPEKYSIQDVMFGGLREFRLDRQQRSKSARKHVDLGKKCLGRL